MKIFIFYISIGLIFEIVFSPFLFCDNYQKTQKLLETEEQLSGEALYKSYVGYGLKNFEEENFEEAKKYFWKALNIDPTQPDAYVNLGIIHLYQQDYETALRLFSEAEKLAADTYSKKEVLYYNLGLLYFKTNEYNKAKEYFLKAIEIYPDFGEALYYLGYCYDVVGEGEPALINIIKAKNAFSRNNQSQLYQKACEAIESLKAKYNQDTTILAQKILEQAEIAHGENRLEQAISLLEESIFLNPENSKAYYILGNIYFEKGATYLALENFKKAVLITPTFFDANLSMGEILVKLKRYDEALDIFNKVLNQDKNNIRANYDLGLLYSKLEKPKEAEKYFLQVRKFSPDSPPKSLINVESPTLKEQKLVTTYTDIKMGKAIQKSKSKSFYATSQMQKNKGIFHKGYYIAEPNLSSKGKRINKFQKTLDY
ncbi:MAG: tetratricopeptide repeat protein [Candidatus Omnitrophica bacterium]|nr:tetratricopeptide repeat protein [Candidatus Omnitrophota bacterium]